MALQSTDPLVPISNTHQSDLCHIYNGSYEFIPSVHRSDMNPVIGAITCDTRVYNPGTLKSGIRGTIQTQKLWHEKQVREPTFLIFNLTTTYKLLNSILTLVLSTHPQLGFPIFLISTWVSTSTELQLLLKVLRARLFSFFLNHILRK